MVDHEYQRSWPSLSPVPIWTSERSLKQPQPAAHSGSSPWRTSKRTA
jgi:hypothetical protein